MRSDIFKRHYMNRLCRALNEDFLSLPLSSACFFKGREMKSILTEAEEIVNGARATDYGSATESFGKIAKMASLMLDASERESMMHDGVLTDTTVCKVLMAVKLTRQANKHKRDNLVDLCGYAELLNRLENVE